jgi:2-methylcitrate dehydratase PrpD
MMIEGIDKSNLLKIYDLLAALRYEDIPPHVIRKAKICLLDTIGVIIGSHSAYIAEKLIKSYDNVYGVDRLASVGIAGRSSIIGTRRIVPAPTAAFINSSLSDVLEMADGIRYGGVHPSSAVIPAVVALSQERNKSGKDLLLSIVVGYEFLGRLSKLIYPQPFWRGFNMTGVCGAFGAAIGCSKLLDFGAHDMANSIGICGLYTPLSSRDCFHYEIKPTHVGKASEIGLLGTVLTESGLEASLQVLETNRSGGICTSMIAQVKPDDFSGLLNSFGEHYELEEVYIKPYSSCRHTHGSIQATLELTVEHDIKYTNVSKVHIGTYKIAEARVGDRRPTMDSQSQFVIRQFSIPYLVAACLIKGSISPNEIFGENASDPALYEFLHRIQVVEDSNLTNLYPEMTATKVDITLLDGRTVSKLIELPKGDPRNPLSQSELEEKFRGLSIGIIGAERTARLLEELSQIEDVDDVNEVIWGA